MRRRGLRLLVVLFALALPLAASLVFSHWLTKRAAAHDLQRLAEASARRSASILADGQRTLEELARSVSGDCNESDQEALRLAGYNSLYYREAGLIKQGSVVCTSFLVYQPPIEIPVDYLRRTPVYARGNFELRSPQPTLLGGRSMVAIQFIDRERLDYVNLLLDLEQFDESMSHFVGVRGYSYLIDKPAQGAEQLTGERPAPLIDPRRTGIHVDASGGMAAVAHAAPFPVAVAVYAPAEHLQYLWAKQAQPAALVGFLLTALAVLLLRRWFPVRASTVEELSDAIASGELEMHYQPIMDASSGRVASAEALVRWRHPTRGLLYPDAFIEVAEANGLIGALTEATLRCIRTALPQLPEDLRIAVNVSPALLRDGAVAQAIDRVFGPGSPLDRLTLEITERELIEYADSSALKTVAGLVGRSAKVSLDDFGTGFSGLSHLRHLKPHQIKIDRSFVRAMDTEAVTAALVDGIVAMTASLGVELVAEGVETAAQREQLLRRGIRSQQGWLYAKAMPLAEFCHYYDDMAGRATPGAT